MIPVFELPETGVALGREASAIDIELNVLKVAIVISEVTCRVDLNSFDHHLADSECCEK
jgi:hypothetical protein